MLAPNHSTLQPISLWRQASGAIALNFVLNGAISWLVFRNTAVLTLWSSGGVGTDLLATGFLLPFLTCLIVSNIVRSQVRGSKIAPDTRASITEPGLHRRSILVRSLWLGAAGVFLAALPIVLTLMLFEPTAITLWSFVFFKAAWTGALAGVISPLITTWAVANASLSLTQAHAEQGLDSR